MNDVLALLASIVVGAGLIWLAFRIEPHWCSKDAMRFTCRIRALTADLADEGVYREMRAAVLGDELHLSSRGFSGRKMNGVYRVMAKSPAPPKGKAIYLVRRESRQMAVRIPANSRAVATLDALLA